MKGYANINGVEKEAFSSMPDEEGTVAVLWDFQYFPDTARIRFLIGLTGLDENGHPSLGELKDVSQFFGPEDNAELIWQTAGLDKEEINYELVFEKED